MNLFRIAVETEIYRKTEVLYQIFSNPTPLQDPSLAPPGSAPVLSRVDGSSMQDPMYHFQGFCLSSIDVPALETTSTNSKSKGNKPYS